MTLLPISSAREATGLALGLVARRRWLLVACTVAFAVEGLAGLVAPWMLGQVVDAVTTDASTSEIYNAAAWILGAAVVGAFASTLAVATLARVAEPALADLREQVLDSALHLETAEVEAAGQGDLISRVGDDVRLIASSFTEVLPAMINSVIAIVFTAGGLFALDWRLGLAGLGAIPFYVLGLRWYLPRSGPYYRRERVANGERAEAFLTGVHASRTLRAYGIAEQHQERVDAASWRSAQISIDVFRLLTRFIGRGNRSELIGLLLIIGTGFALVRSDETTVGAVTAAALFFHRLFNPIGTVLGLFDEVQSAGASLTRLAGLALLRPPPAPDDQRTPADTGLAVIALHHEYVAGRVAVDDVDLTVHPGQRVAVVGASGAGKSTLGAAIAGRLPATRGEIRLGGVPMDHVLAGDRPAVALVSQEVHVFSGTVRDNLTLAAPDAGDAELETALVAVGAWGAVQALPDGLDTVVGDGAVALSPALAQQLALARVLLADPLVVVLDEATAEAGSSGALELERAALAATRGRTSVVIAHRLTQARDADLVVVMDAGRVVESGTHDDLVAADGVYADLWAAWSA